MEDLTLRFLLACQAGAIVAGVALRDNGSFTAQVMMDTFALPPPPPPDWEDGGEAWLSEKAAEWVDYQFQGRGTRRDPEHPLARTPRPDWMG